MQSKGNLFQQLIKQDLPDYASHKKCVKEMCFNYENVSSIESENVDKMLDETFSSPTPVSANTHYFLLKTLLVGIGEQHC